MLYNNNKHAGVGIRCDTAIRISKYKQSHNPFNAKLCELFEIVAKLQQTFTTVIYLSEEKFTGNKEKNGKVIGSPMIFW